MLSCVSTVVGFSQIAMRDKNNTAFGGLYLLAEAELLAVCRPYFFRKIENILSDAVDDGVSDGTPHAQTTQG
jgi:hypothetical protein